ncbi:hypothetical protein PQX77_015209 [Marasmius sp. AFHP31]|nr:hypothetical protein PQX77_015209 [Marasmius sp. AFHP31]
MFISLLHRKLVKRLHELINDLSALKANLLLQMDSLSKNLSTLLAQQTLKHVADARSAKPSFQLTTIVGFTKELASATPGITHKPGALWWEAVSETITQLAQEGGKLLPTILEVENVVKSMLN